MPPQLSDDERSESNDEGAALQHHTPENTGRPQSFIEEELSLMVESDEDRKEGDNGEEEDDDEIGEDEYVVEAITDHAIDEHGTIFFEVKWEGFSKKSDRTMEPEENLADTASEILTSYINKVGGRESILRAWEETKQASSKGKKRARATSDTNGNGAKRGRKGQPGSETPSASARNAEFKPPTGSWEDDVVNIDACEGAKGSVVVYLTWKNGQKSQHPLVQVYKRCPQRMLRFYESHLVFKKDKDAEEDE